MKAFYIYLYYYDNIGEALLSRHEKTKNNKNIYKLPKNNLQFLKKYAKIYTVKLCLYFKEDFSDDN